ncbi:MAG TPA: hypothetical protein VK750_09795, partial [Cytophagaceae bacterium]|nr:hypothetical protein [Cytophagaceae bacterium]
MLEQLKNRISDIQSIGSIELQMDSNGEVSIHWLLLSKRGQLLVIEKSGTLAGNFNALPSLIPTSLPLVLSCSGKGILHKKVQQQGSNQEKLFHNIFPNARISEYVIQYVPCSPDSFFVSVMRKDQMERMMQEITALGYSVLSLSLGAFAVVP